MKQEIKLKQNMTYVLTNEAGVEITIIVGEDIVIKGEEGGNEFVKFKFPTKKCVSKQTINSIDKNEKSNKRVGYDFVNSTGHLCEIIEYINSNKVIVLFKDYGVTTSTAWKSCENGTVKVPFEVQKKDRIGERFQNKEGYWYEIIQYNSSTDVVIKFDGQDERFTYSYGHISSGGIKNPYHPNVFGIGYIGVGKFMSTLNGKQTKEYRDWSQILHRCYYQSYIEQRPSYIDVEVCEEWHNFQNFAKWHEENYYEVEGEKMALDKDLFGGKIYSPKTCVYLPIKINGALAHMDSLVDKRSYFLKLVEEYQGAVPNKVICELNKLIKKM